ncbi:non-ribosomal peptide synthase/polyketide synthase [Archangium violaceum]|uniref:non-ribosomal peptide synthase/polyketide synthase n=1 Tax=Archangium violaceum TaxID=83451 RepID=UPI002B2CB878|nr:non-ribosomal peptide synthase/polyketide synthase [Archangium gephyra]
MLHPHARSPTSAATLIDLLRQAAASRPGQRLFTFLGEGEGEETELTYDALEEQARRIGAVLQQSARLGERVILLYPPGLEYIAGFFGCLYAGLVAVPAYPPDPSRLDRTLPRLRAIIQDAQATVVLTTSFIASMGEFLFEQAPELRALRWVATDELPAEAGASWQPPEVGTQSLAFLQYTSGSTGMPKGVKLSHGNLLHNLKLISHAFQTRPDSVGVIWLPPYHDMGLIGGILEPLYQGMHTALMSPLTFLKQPLRWLQAISRFGGTISGGPNFAFDLCVRKISPEERRSLDLSRWEVAFCGAEPIRAETLARFSEAFGPRGFRHQAFYPCYGLAEGTLIVSGGDAAAAPSVRALDESRPEGSRPLVGCGRAMPEQEILIVDPESLTRCPPGTVGEIWVSGPSIAQGYWQRPEETEQTFQARLADGGPGTFLRTGDLGTLVEGELFVTGRRKDLIILRGRNHYPQDIELTVEQSHPALRPGCGAAFSIEVEGEERLAVVQEADPRKLVDSDRLIAEIRQRIAEQHEVQLHTLVLIEPGGLPKTSSGKVQRRASRATFLAGELTAVLTWRAADATEASALPPRDDSPGVSDGAPGAKAHGGDVEAWLRSRLAARFGLRPEQIDSHEPITRYGMDSLGAAELAHEIERGLGSRLPLAQLIRGPSLSELVEQLLARGDSSEPPLRPMARGDALPLSFAQQRLWFLDQLEPGNSLYNLAAALRLDGPLDVGALERSLNELVRRHEVLRTTIAAGQHGPVQVIAPAGPVMLSTVDLGTSPPAGREAEALRRAQEEAQRPFELARGPLLRVTLLKLDDRVHLLVVAVHHIVFDGASMGVMIREVSALYEAFTRGQRSPLAELPLQYADYAGWQRQWLQGEALHSQLSYWKQQLSGVPHALELSTDLPRPATQSFRGGSLPIHLPLPLSEALESLSQRQGVTPFMTLLASFQVLLQRYSGQDDFCVGSPIAGRDRSALEGLVGFFVNTLVHRAHLSGDPSFLLLLSRVKDAALGAYAHQDLPFEKLVEELKPQRDSSRSPLFQVIFSLQPDALPELKLPGLSVGSLALDSHTSKFDLGLSLTRGPDGFRGSLEYSSDLFLPSTISQLAGHLRTLLESLVSNPSQRLSQLSVLSPEERQRVLVEWNATSADYPRHSTIHELFQAQASQRPDSVAVESGSLKLTYRQLDERSNQLAHSLRRLGVGPDSRVALCLERSLELIVSLLAILKAGGAYVPLDSSYPRQRLSLMLEDSQPQVLVTTRALLPSLPADGLDCVLLDEVHEALARESTAPVRSGALPQHLAYIDFTSGSTGRPKGVCIEHRSVLRTLLGVSYAHLGPEHSFLLLAPISFDASTLEVWGPLLHGARLVLFPPHSPTDVHELADILSRHHVTTLHLTSGLFTQMVDSHLEGLRPLQQLLTGGDVVSAPHVQRVLQALRIPVTACYGPTEGTLFSSCLRMTQPSEVGPSVPIGRPISNTQLYVLDSHLQPVPPGVPGELFISGDGLARGYLGASSLTAERFLPNPFSSSPGARMYRTGDLARHRHDGVLEFLGRLDSQVKVRGFRIELSEVESALLSLPGVREAVALAREDSPGLKRLVAYFTGDSLSPESLRSSLQQRLPEYMVPSSFVHLPALPLTSHGKVDRKALPAPDSRPELSQTFLAPRSDIEQTLSSIWAEVLHLERVGILDNFFELGGHSLLATQAISRVRTAFAVELPLRDLFDAPTIAALAPRVHAARQSRQGFKAPPLLPVPRTGRLPLSFAQQRLFFLDQLEPHNPAYNMPAALRLEGALDLAALERSFNELVRRHESLRTTFQTDQDGVVQVISPSAHQSLAVTDLRERPEATREQEVLRLAEEESRRPFDLARGPLLRVALLRLAEHEHVLLLTMHHIVSDGWSMGVMIREVSALYEAFTRRQRSPLAELPLQYADYAGWQRQWLQGEALHSQLSYWKQQLSGVPHALELSTDLPRPATQSFRGGSLPIHLPLPLSEALESLSQRQGVTPFMTLLASFQVLLQRYSGQDDFCVGSPIAGRDRSALEGLVGFFVNTLVHRAHLSGDPSFLLLLSRVKDAALGAYAHQDLPFEKLVEELKPQRDSSRSPLFQVIFSLQPDALPELKLPGLSVGSLALDSHTSKFDLGLSLTRGPDGFRGSLEYSSDLFLPSTISQLAGHLRTLLESLVSNPSQRLSQLSVLSPEERQRVLVEWNATSADYPRHSTIHELFQAQASQRPDSVAVESGSLKLTYRQLDERSNQLAHSLRRLGVGPDSRVALCLERSLELIVSLLAILKAGGAYVPLDSSYPRQRLSLMLADSQPQVLVTTRALLPSLPADGLDCVLLDEVQEALARESTAPVRSGALPQHLAYIDFTSGSTGRPKGVCIEHRSVLRTLLGVSYAHLGPEHSFLLLAPISFDASTLEVWGPLLHGARLVLFPPHSPSDVHELADILSRHHVTTLHLTSGLFTQVVDSHLEALRPLQQLLTGGDVVSAPHVQRVLETLRIPVTACYGPTESTLFSSCLRMTQPSDVGASVPIGRPISNTQLYVLDSHLQPVPPGVPGELFISGDGLARGYLGASSLTAERFLPNPFSSSPGARMYRTGDLARHRHDGVLEFLGRLDSQVKVRGFRIELSEVESALLSLPGVREAVALAREDSPGLKRLVAYFTGDSLSPESLRSSLQQRLPEYMVPSSFVHLPALPLTSHGKVDRKALPAPDSRPELSQAFLPPRSDIERTLSSIWSSVLRLQRVGVLDNFFELGGDSISSLQVISRARQAGLHLSPRQLFQHQTIAELAPHLTAASGHQAEQGLVTGPVPLTPIQRAFFEEASPRPHHFNQSVLLETREPLDGALLERALRQLVEHHDALRMRFVQESDGWQQLNAGLEQPVSLLQVDLSSTPETEQAFALESEASKLQASFELSSGLLLRAALFHRGPRRTGRLLLTVHHLVVDTVSWRTLLEDLESLYVALRRSETPALPPKTTSFKTWAERLRAHARSGALQPELAFWLGEGRPAPKPLPLDAHGENTLASARTVTLSLDAEETRLLLQDVPAAYRARIDEVLLTALVESVSRWTGEPRLRLELEGHGREDLFDDVDLSRTVGWFTSAYPVELSVPAKTSPGDRLRAVREGLRRVPGRGMGFGLLRHLGGGDAAEALRALPAPQVSFNYLGQFDTLASGSSLFALAREPSGPMRAQEALRRQVLEVGGLVLGGRLELSFTYSENLHQRATIEALATDTVSALRTLIARRSSEDAARLGPSDFPLANLEQTALDRLLRHVPAPEDIYPLSPMQQGMLFHVMLAPESGEYFEQITWSIHSRLDLAAFRRAWEAMVASHPALRTSFHWEGLAEPLQAVHPQAELPWRELDWRGRSSAEQDAALEALLQEDRTRGFELSRAPLMRFSVMRLDESVLRMVWSFHHLLLDGWSLGLLLEQLFAAYESFARGQSPRLERGPAYREYIAWLRRQELSRAEAHWRLALSGFTAPTPLPGDRTPSRTEDVQTRPERTWVLPAALTESLQDFARRHQLTPNTLIQAAWALLLSQYSGERDVVFGTTVAGRPAELPGAESTIGLFINTLPVRVRLPPEARVVPWLRELQAQQAELRQYEHTPLVRIQEWSDVARGSPLFESLLVFENWLDAAVKERTASLDLRDVRGLEQTTYPLNVNVLPGRELALRLSYDARRFDGAMLERVLAQWQTLLGGLVERPDARLSELSPLSERERHQLLVEWNATRAPLPREACAHELFEAQAARTPEALALISRDTRLTFGELNARANRLAWHLRGLGVGPDVRVGLCLERSPELIVGALGILKAGGAYVPMDPEYPHERLAFMLTDSQVPVLVTREELADQLPVSGAQVICLDSDAAAVAAESPEDPVHLAGSEHLAYVIYTSGSTGRPKGVMVEHRGLVNYLTWCTSAYGMHEGAGAPVHSPLAFDLTVTSLLLPLTTGQPVTLVPEDQGVEGLGSALLSGSDFSLVKLTPTHLSLLSQQLPSARAAGRTRSFVIGGEALSFEALSFWRQHAPSTRLLNEYGPTETVVGCCVHEVSATDAASGAVPIGRPISNVELHVLDSHLRLVPVGAPGELYIGGVPLARGYLGRPELTAEKFVPHPFSSVPGARLYRTGDLARRRADGVLEFLGRLDEQVKVRGFRIELGEIETVLSSHPSVRECAVVVREDVPGDKRLVAYVTSPSPQLDSSEPRRFLESKLPVYMVPSAFVVLEALPLTPNGKVDRKALPAPGASRPELAAFRPPSTPTEELLAGIWAEVLRLEKVGRQDDFFELGGHSLIATQVVSRIQAAFGVELPLGELFAATTLAALAARIDSAVQEGQGLKAPPLVPVPRTSELPLSFAQQRLWFLQQLEPASSFYNIPLAVRFEGLLDEEALERSFGELVRRHESVRMTFQAQDGRPVQVPRPASALSLAHVDLRNLPADAREAEARRLSWEEARRPFELASGPLLRASLLKLGEREHVLLLTMHHIISDGWSMGVLIREMVALYEALSSGRPSPLPEPALQYADYAAWQRQWLRGEALETQLSYWKQQLDGAPRRLELPTDHPRPAMPTYRGARYSRPLPNALTEALKALSRREGATLFMTLMAAFQALLARHSGQHDVLVGTDLANRTRAETEGLIGFFINQLVMRGRLDDAPTFRELLARTRETALAAYAHQDLPFEELVRVLNPERGGGHAPLFQTKLILQNAPMPAIELPGLTLTPLEVESGAARLDLVVSLMETADGLSCTWDYSTDLFEASTIERMAGHYQRLLEGIAAHPEQRLEELPLLSDEEQRQLLVDWNGTKAELPREECAHRLFEAQAARTPHASAVAFGEAVLTYAELDQRANRLAHHLRSLGVGPETRVGLCLERSLEVPVAMLAILKAGGAFVPLDPSYPAARLAFVLADAGISLLVTQEPIADELPTSAQLVCLDSDAQVLALQPGTAPDSGVTGDNLAYVLYTSGSTGTPKGALLHHRGLCNTALAAVTAHRFRPDSRVLQFASPAFDASVCEVFSSLLAGACLVLAPREELLPDSPLRTLLEKHAITAVTLTPSVLAQLSNEGLPCLETLISAGEALPPSVAQRWSKGRTLLNAYGPTEVTVCASISGPVDTERPTLGRPFPNVELFVLDGLMRPVPVGAPGELYVGGVGLARGYLGRPELTAERFLPHPFCSSPGSRLYRTGDRVRYLPDGQVEFLGRVDEQVKLRGFRIELGEVEAALARHPAVREATAVVREDSPGQPRLVAYLVLDERQSGEPAGLRTALKEQLPEYMVPSAFVSLPSLPLTGSGKVDRKALPAPDGVRPEDATAFVAPRSALEQQLAAMWSKLLGVERVGVHDNFFDLGGHSLLATQLISRLRATFEVELPLNELFENPTVATLATKVEPALLAGQAIQTPALVPAPRGGPLPLSFAQQRLWFLDQLEPGSALYNIPAAVRLEGSLDVAALEHAFTELVRRHEALRTTFASHAGQPVQRISSAAPLSLAIANLQLLPEAEREAQLMKRAADESRRPFDLSAGPLLRTLLFQLSPREHVLLLTMHHIVSDGWSMGVLIRELVALYEAFSTGKPSPLPEPPLQYADYAAWQRQWLQDEALEQQLSFWRGQLEDAPAALELPTDHPRPAVPSSRGASHPVRLPLALSESLEKLGQHEGATPFMVLLAAFQTLLARYSGQDDVCVGTPIAGRRHAELEGMLGCFVNTLVLRARPSADLTFRELLAQVRATTLGAFAHQDLPFEKLVDAVQPERQLGRSPLFQVMFVLQNAPTPALSAPGLGVRQVDLEGWKSTFELTFSLTKTAEGFAGFIEYSTDLFEASTIERMAGHFQRLLEAITAHPEQRLADVSLLSTEERRRLLVEWNDTRVEPAGEPCAHQLFEAQVARAPDAVALVSGDTRLSYSALERRANQLAHHLRTLGVGPETRVALCVERSPDLVLGLLGILKAGGVYVPLDSSLPAERLASMLDEASPTVVLTQESFAARLPGGAWRVVCLDPGAEELSRHPESTPGVRLEGANGAYIIFTSGSTGRPKGVLVEHRGVTNTLRRSIQDYGLRPGQRMLQWASMGFDVSVQEILSALGSGATLVLTSRQLVGPELLALVREQGITTLTLTPPALAVLPEAELPALETVLIGGEACPAELMDRWAKGRRFITQYGPTEASIAATSASCTPGSGQPPLGRPFPNTVLYVLDERMRPVPLGVRGELYLGGLGVARGYFGHPELTAERFVPDPFSAEPGARLYRTGDLVRYRADGMLEFRGRADTQVKVRGFRIELGELESVLTGHPSVEQAAVLVREDVPGDKRLVAYVVPGPGAALDVTTLRGFLQDTLPEYMLPSAIVPLEALPVTANGKVDRKALPAPQGLPPRAEFVPPEGEVERTLAAAWAPLLGIERVGRHDHFFELGGHSLLATQAITRVRDTLGVELPLRSIFEHPTVAALAARIDEASRNARASKTPPLQRAPRTGRLPLSFAQQRLWFIDQLDPNSNAFNIPTAVRLRGTLDLAAMERGLNELVRRHEALRTTFAAEEGRPFQVIAPASERPLPTLDLRQVPDAEREARMRQAVTEEARRPFDLIAGPLMRTLLLQLGPREHVLLMTMHHIIADGGSMGVLIRELAALYEAFSAGRPSPLPEPALQYADYACWQQEWLQGEVLEEQLSWWREELSSAPQTLELPTDRPCPATMSGRGAQYDIRMSRSLSDALDALGRREGATPFMVLLAAFNTLMSRYSGQRDLLIGTDVANRTHAKTEEMLGFFINQLVLRARLEGDPTVRELIARTRETTLAAQAHQELPFEELVRALNPARNDGRAPLFQVKFTLQHAPTSKLVLPGLTLESLPMETHSAKLDLLVVVGHGEEGLSCTWEYSTDLFDRDTVARMAGHFQTLLEGFAAAPEARLSELTLLSDAERQRLMEWSGPQLDFRDEACFTQRFEAQVERTPDAPAVTFEDEHFTYRELNRRANQLAHRLRAMGVRPDSRVALCMHRSLDLMVSVLGILKAGGAYVPVEPETPAERLASILEEAQVAVVLTQEELAESIPEVGARVLYLDAEWEAISRKGSPENPAPLAGAGNLAYVIYTSGSTGRPKGVAVEHRQLCGYTAAVLERMKPPPGASFATVSTIAADLGNTMVFPALCSGGNLHVLSKDRVTSPEAFAEYFERHGIDCLKIVPSHLAALMSASRPERVIPRGLLVLGGEASSREWIERIQRLRPGCDILNHYGPTETTVGVLTWPVPRDGLPSRPNIPTGFPLAGAQVLVLDAHMRPVPVGIAGELYIGGAGVARGYLGRPELTAERFVPNPFTQEPGGRLYRTGDLARRLADGSVEFLGRVDDQVKIRGFRVELAEVEEVLRRHPDVREVTVQAREVAPGDRRLVAYVVPTPARATTVRGKKRYVLPNKVAVAQLNRNETDYIYKEIFELQAYLRHGVTLNDGDCVFDVGSNIGLFSVFANLVCEAPRIFAFEPNPTVNELVRINASLYGKNMTVFDCGIAAEEGSAEFTFFPGFSLLSGFHADAETEKSVVKAYMLNQENMSPEELAGLTEGADELLEERFEAKSFTARLRTLSDLIDEQGVERIDLLKVNVEKSELQVLSGLREEHWGLIRQMVVEIDVKENVEPITELVRSHGFELLVDQDVLLSGTQLCYLYAIRPSEKGRLVPQREPNAHLRTLPVLPEPFLTQAELARWLGDKLPQYMVPSAIVMMEALPLTPNGKVDRQALPAPSTTSDERAFVAPRNQTEEQLAKICAELLNIPRVGIHDDFFELGGHSLLGTQVISRIRATFGADLRLRDLFDTPTVAGLAARIVDLRAEQVGTDQLEDLLAEIEGLSDEEVRAQLEGSGEQDEEQPTDAPVKATRKASHE